MTQKNVEMVRAIYERWQTGDFSSAEWADPEIELNAVGALDDGTYRGHDEMATAWARWLSSFDHFSVGAAEFHDTEDEVIGVNYFAGSGHASGVPVAEARGAARFKIRDGKVVVLSIYLDAERALQEAGIDP